LHRDIKPGNVKITSSGQVYLVDFGLAKVAYTGQRTTTGARAMTPGYSPPEQYGGARTDNRSDIYSLGATLYAALTGSVPEDSLARTMQQVELTQLRKLNAQISRKTAEAIEKALEAYPKDRFQNAEAFKQAMLNDSDSANHKDAAQPVSMIDRGSIPSISKMDGDLRESHRAGAFSISTQLAEDDFLLTAKPRPTKKRGCFPFLIVFLMILIVGGGVLSFASPALFQQLSDYASSFVTERLSGEQENSQNTATATLKVVPAENAVMLITETPLAASNTPLPTFTSTAAETPTVTATAKATIAPTPLATAFGGGQGQIAFASDRTGLAQIWLVNIDGSELRQLTHAQRGACQPSWSPDGARLVYISPCKENQEIYTNTNLFIVDVDGSNTIELPTSSSGDFDPAWSPDGRFIAFTSILTNGRAQIYLMELITQKVQRLSEKYFMDINPSWSADSKQLVFISSRNGPHQIWTMNIDGSNQLRFSTSGDKKNTHPVWAYDGKEVLFTQSIVGGVPQLMAAYFPTGAMQEYRVYSQAGVTPMREASYSPDATWMAFESWPDGTQHDIYTMRANGDELKQLTFDAGKDFDAVWRPIAP
jgi:Tol biopolymer transport system component